MWLGTVAKNFVLQAARGKVRRLARERAAARSIIDEQGDAMVDEALRQRLLTAVDGLDEPYRTAIRLRFFEDLPPTLIAERQRQPVGTVRRRIKRGLAMVRARLFHEPRRQ